MSVAHYWSATVAEDWEHGLPIGDGVMGALLFGSPDDHRLTLAHERVVLPTDPIRRAPRLADDLPTIRGLIRDGRAQDAADLAVSRSQEQGYPGIQWTDPLVPTATVVMPGRTADPDSYRRDVDLDTGLITVSWTSGGDPRRIRAFMSRADGVLVVQVPASAGDPRLVPPANVATSQSGVRGGNEHHVRFEERPSGDGEQVLVTRFVADWEFSPAGAVSRLRVLDRDDDQITVAVRTAPIDIDNSIADDLPESFDALLDRHLAAFDPAPALLELDARRSGESTDSLLASTRQDHARERIELQFRAAQAAITASAGALPPTLQGVWSGTFDPAWSSDYTMNGNVQNGSIASMLATGHPEQLRSFLDLLWGFRHDFAENADRLFGADGWVLPSRCSPTHGKTTHFDGQHCHEFWTAGGAWAARFFLDYVWYTGDLDYLRTVAYPFALAVERFYLDFLTWEGDTVAFSPSYSPENRSPTFGSQACRNATMDRAALNDLLDGLLRSARLLGIDDDLIERRTLWRHALPAYRIAPDGTLAEWLDDGVIENVGHRTASQLLGLWFEPDPVITDDPALAEAARRLIRAKLDWRAADDGVEEMAYGLVQLGVAAAALRDADAALECIDRMSRLYFLPSLATTHDVGAIFNVDIGGGFPAVICAMLVTSTPNSMSVLPALPSDWATGRVSGLHLRGALAVDELTWSEEEVLVRMSARVGSMALREGSAMVVKPPDGFRFDGAAGDGPGSIDVALVDGASVELVARRFVDAGELPSERIR